MINHIQNQNQLSTILQNKFSEANQIDFIDLSVEKAQCWHSAGTLAYVH